MSKIIAIGKALPGHKHRQQEILNFMSRVYAFSESDHRKLKHLYRQSGISHRYSVLADYSLPPEKWSFYPATENLEPFPSIEKRMQCFNNMAPALSETAIRNCLAGHLQAKEVTHLITITCTGLSAPGLDLQLMELLELPRHIFRTSINFMGCYAAIHGLKLADTICKTDPQAKVIVVCTELCTLHFQQEPTLDNILSGLLFGDGSAAALITADAHAAEGLHLEHFYSEVKPEGKQEMNWALSSTGFIMTLRSYIPGLIEADFNKLVKNALNQGGYSKASITSWCIHPGGRRILEAIAKSLDLPDDELDASYEVLNEFGNMSSATILFVLDSILRKNPGGKPLRVFGAAFGPGLTMETFIAGACSTT